ncbi:hypothetical protein M879_21395 [Mycobacteroides abscessus V06705]|nr:hypothetical protein M879_21395 [Mycobacteroides abscessus V06705]
MLSTVQVANREVRTHTGIASLADDKVNVFSNTALQGELPRS